MASSNLNDYVNEVCKALDYREGIKASELLSFSHSHIANARLRVEAPEAICSRILAQPFDEMVAAHIKTIWSSSKGNHDEAWQYQNLTVMAFIKGFQQMKEENWALPLMQTLILDLRNFARRGDKRIPGGKPGERQEKAAETIMSAFRACTSDTRTRIDDSKRWGMLFVVNQLFKTYFAVGKLHLLKPLIRAIDACDIRDEFSLSQRVTYQYYVGRKALLDSNFALADEYLSFAYRNCHPSSFRNRKLILVNLIAVKMLMGQIPKQELLMQNGLREYRAVVHAMKTGNIGLMDDALAKHEYFFVKSGTYLIIEKLKLVVIRQLFKKVMKMAGHHQIQLQIFLDAINFAGLPECDMEELECLMAGLISHNLIRGYISHQYKKVVFSRKEPFPVIKKSPLTFL